MTREELNQANTLVTDRDRLISVRQRIGGCTHVGIIVDKDIDSDKELYEPFETQAILVFIDNRIKDIDNDLSRLGVYVNVGKE